MNTLPAKEKLVISKHERMRLNFIVVIFAKSKKKG